MVTKKYIFLLGFLFTFLFSYGKKVGNENTTTFRFTTFGVLSYGYNTSFKSNNAYLHGSTDFAWGLKETLPRFSSLTDGFIYITQFGNSSIDDFKFNHSMFIGVNYTFLKKKSVELSLTLQPGINLSKRNYSLLINDSIVNCNCVEPSTIGNAMLGSSFNFAYYPSRQSNFSFFTSLRYVYGLNIDNYTIASLSEFRISFGLGFYISNFKK